MAGNELPTEYDEIVLGTGLQESILAAALARIGHRVIHLDRNDYYSGDWASFNLNGILDWVNTNTDESGDVEEAPNPPADPEGNLLQEGERLVSLPHNPKTAFNIQVKRYVQEGNLDAIQERPIVFPPPDPVPENNDNQPPQEQQDAEAHGASGQDAHQDETTENRNDENQSASNSLSGTVEGDVTEKASGSELSTNDPTLQGTDSAEGQQTSSRSESQQTTGESGSHQTQEENESVATDQATHETPAEGQAGEGQRSSDNQEEESARAEGGQDNSEQQQEAEGAVGGGEASTSAAAEAAAPAPPARRVWTWADIKRQWRKFNIDLAPKLMFCRGSMVELLVSSRISRYAEFKAVTRILTHINGQLEQVPCSRADVFSSKYVNMLEKRMLMRLIEFCLNHQNLQDQYEAYKDRPFVEFLTSRKLTPTLQHFVIHSIAMALVSMQYFLRSLGRYGNTAFLWTLYGSGELPQCFCRMCAVFAGIYMLRSQPRGIIIDAENKCKGIVDPEGRRLTCNHIVMEHSYIPSRASAVRLGYVSRGVLITNKSLKPSEYDEITFLTVPPPDENSNPVRVLELNYAACACPRDLFLVHLTCKGRQSANEDLQYAIQQLFQPLTQDEEDLDSEKPKVLWSLFFNQLDASDCDDAILTEGLPTNAMVTAGPGDSVGFEHAVTQARHLFERICPGEEFLPPAPDPEDIIFEDPSRDNPGEHKEVGFETPSNDNQNPAEDKPESENKDDENQENKPSPEETPAEETTPSSTELPQSIKEEEETSKNTTENSQNET
ncbi:rab proteins geranylgeranyltransferase component A 2-like isoform X2 [Amphiura filiformis]|uniref:rab proteins geranylgeranyltransferase component A 2-like isoform X2 n=1 Tax=Amphiura filiformis TaxID=82378 RepID=UPI003B215A42